MFSREFPRVVVVIHVTVPVSSLKHNGGNYDCNVLPGHAVWHCLHLLPECEEYDNDENLWRNWLLYVSYSFRL